MRERLMPETLCVPGYIGGPSSAVSRTWTVGNDAAPNPSFEDSLAELEGIVRTLEDGTTGLDEALAAYERGVGLLKGCYQHLRQAEQRILKLTGTDADGRPTLELFG